MRKFSRSCVGLCALVFAPTLVFAATPSFVCSQAKSWVEKTICASDKLSELDLKLAVSYARALKSAKGEDRKSLESDQRLWWGARETCRKVTDPNQCLEERYQGRIAAIESRPGFSADARAKPVEQAPDPIVTAGEGWTKELSSYMKAMRACREESSASIQKVLTAWTQGTDDSVGFHMVDGNQKHWICVAARGGHKVFSFDAYETSMEVPPPGPVYHINATAVAPACEGGKEVLDSKGKSVGWITQKDC